MHTFKGFRQSYQRKYSGGFVRIGLDPNSKSKFYQEIKIINGEPKVIAKGKNIKKKAG